MVEVQTKVQEKIEENEVKKIRVALEPSHLRGHTCLSVSLPLFYRFEGQACSLLNKMDE